MKLTLGALFFVFLCGAGTVQAAALYIDPGQITISRGDAVKLSIRLDTDEQSEECVNAAEGVLRFEGPITPVDISLGGSIFSVWVEPPQINETTKEVTFAGGIPNGYCGRVDGDPSLTNNMFDVIVRADATIAVDDTSVVSIVSFTDQTAVYENDGLGTKLATDTFPSEITIMPTMREEVLDPWSEEIKADISRPQPFSIQLENDRLAFSGKYYISFNTTDKQTGIDRYEVVEENLSQFFSFTWGGTNVPWKEVRSPYVLEDQTLNSTIRVRAIDKAGNEYVATLIPDEELRTLSFNQILVYILVGLLVVVFLTVSVVFIRKRRRTRLEREQMELESIEQSYE